MLALPHSLDWRRRRPCSQRLILDHAKDANTRRTHPNTQNNSDRDIREFLNATPLLLYRSTPAMPRYTHVLYASSLVIASAPRTHMGTGQFGGATSTKPRSE
eukprot:scaffold55073_cov67-Phaeocystis_antarctica.AAC.2